MANEKPLHAALKEWYARPGDRLEAAVDGYLVDILRGDTVIEIQTRSFSSIRAKLLDLVERHPVHLVYPVARDRWIVRMTEDGGACLGRRRSPKHGAPVDVFNELVSFPELVSHASFSLEVLLVNEEEVRHPDRKRSWRRKGWVTSERRLLKVVDLVLVGTAAELVALVPVDLPEPFSTADLARALGRPRGLAQRMAYCLRLLGCIVPAGKRGNAVLYARGGL